MNSRCDACLRFERDYYLSGHGPYEHSPNFIALEESAEKGCNLCRLIRQHILYRGHLSFRGDPQESEPSVKLYDGLELYAGLGREMSADSTSTVLVSGEPDFSCVDHPIHAPCLDSLEGISQLDSVVSLIRQWIGDCLENHTSCSRDLPSRPPPLPTRVVDVGTENEGANLIRLYKPEPRSSAEYVTLSYCWGPDPSRNLRTTPSNKSAMYRAIDFFAFPKTIQEAVAVTRKLGVRYLWVDALCIVQADEHDSEHLSDWHVECGKLWGYYENALCTIAATASPACTEGLFLSRPGLKYPVRPCPMNDGSFINPSFPFFVHAVGGSPLCRRGWALQEHSSSARIIHFTEHCIFWRCSERIGSESSPLGHRPQDHMSGIENSLPSPKTFRENRHTALWWYKFVKNCAVSEFTHSSDKLPAISSFAKKIQEETQDEYLAGIWEMTASTGLSWVCSFPPNHRTMAASHDASLAPSWSWASVSQPCGMSFLSNDDPTSLIIIASEMQLVGADKTGQVSHGRLTVEGWCCEMDLAGLGLERSPSMPNNFGGNITVQKGHAYGYISSHNPIAIRFDYVPEGIGDAANALCLHIFTDHHAVNALILKATGKENKGILEYRRIGLIQMSKPHWAVGEKRTLDLV